MRTLRPAFLTVIALSFPSVADSVAAQTQAQLCDAAAGTRGVVEGAALDMLTALPLQGTEVTARWSRDERSDRRAEKKTETDREGRFRFCDLPVDTRIVIQVFYGGQPGETGAARVTAGEPATLTLRAEAGISAIAGRVIDDGTRQPIASAVVRLGDSTQRQITRSDGSFAFDKVPSGTWPLVVEHVAYTTIVDSVRVEPFAIANALIRMATTVIPVDPIEVSVRSFVLERNGFYRRQERASGHFLTRQQIESMQPHMGSDVLRTIAGVRLERGRFGNIALGRGSCPFRFILNGARLLPGFSMDDVSPHGIEGIEVYMGAAGLPIEFQGFSSDASGTCGVIVIWLRNRA
jgi:hypothetical protein